MGIFINNSRNLTFRAVFAFNMRSRHVSYWALIWGLQRTKAPARPPGNTKVWGVPVEVTNWQRNSQLWHQGAMSLQPVS